MNPYRGTTFYGFILQLLERMSAFLTGNLSLNELASDEVQILVLGGLAISGALVGTFLVLRRMTMLANSLSHTILLGIVLAYLLTGQGLSGSLNLPVLCGAALLTALGTTFLTGLLTRSLQEDAAIGLVFTTLFALGILMVTLFTRNVHIGSEIVMGNADALHTADLKLVGWILLGNIVTTGVFLRFYRMTTFDPGFSRSLGFSTTLATYLLMTQVSTTVIGGFRAVGVLMILAFLVASPLAARRLTDRLGKLLFAASAIGLLASILGVATARHLLSVYGLPLSTSGLVTCFLMSSVAITSGARALMRSVLVSRQRPDPQVL